MLCLLTIWCSIGRADIGAGVKAGGSAFEVEVLGPRWFGDALCLTLAANMGADEEGDLPRLDAPPLDYTATQTVDSWALKFGAIWFPWPQAAWRPYIGAGTGVSFRDWELREQTIEDHVVIEETRTTDRGIEWIGWTSLGLEVVLSNSWSLTVEGQYYVESDFHDVDMGGFSAFGGIRWRF
jgi:hypothetical protein